MCMDSLDKMMDGLDFYQSKSEKYAIYPNRGNNPEYVTIGLNGEAGEIANKIKKIQRDGLDKDSIAEDIGMEIGDVLWYLAQLASEFDLSLGAIAFLNLEKLGSRRLRGVLGGSGDDR